MGTLDVPPLAQDLAAAAKLRGALEGSRFTRYYTSPLQRARRTLEAVFPDAAVVVDVRLCERCLGDWQGRPRSHVRASEPHAFTARGHADLGFTPDGGEPFSAFADRVADFLLHVAALASSEHVFAVSHSGVLKAMRYLLGWTLEDASNSRERALRPVTFDLLGPPQRVLARRGPERRLPGADAAGAVLPGVALITDVATGPRGASRTRAG
jgi:broad specificity phosphatase PhoE